MKWSIVERFKLGYCFLPEMDIKGDVGQVGPLGPQGMKGDQGDKGEKVGVGFVGLDVKEQLNAFID